MEKVSHLPNMANDTIVHIQVVGSFRDQMRTFMLTWMWVMPWVSLLSAWLLYFFGWAENTKVNITPVVPVECELAIGFCSPEEHEKHYIFHLCIWILATNEEYDKSVRHLAPLSHKVRDLAVACSSLPVCRVCRQRKRKDDRTNMRRKPRGLNLWACLHCALLLTHCPPF